MYLSKKWNKRWFIFDFICFLCVVFFCLVIETVFFIMNVFDSTFFERGYAPEPLVEKVQSAFDSTFF